MKEYWTESVSSYEGRNTTIEPYEDIPVYLADEVDAEIERLRKALEKYIEKYGKINDVE